MKPSADDLLGSPKKAMCERCGDPTDGETQVYGHHICLDCWAEAFNGPWPDHGDLKAAGHDTPEKRVVAMQKHADAWVKAGKARAA